MKISIIIPAYNESRRIQKTCKAYFDFFAHQGGWDTEFIIALNGCTDDTAQIVCALRSEYAHVIIIDLPQAGKGCALKAGFADALTRSSQIIGFVDADMATTPEVFFDLLLQLNDYDGIIASRYMPGSHLDKPRPIIKRWGSKLIYEPLVKLFLGLSYYDLQCGAKLFKRPVIEKTVFALHQTQWAFDVELLYLCKKYNFRIIEVPTIWHDQSGSKLRMFGQGMRMLGAVILIRIRHSFIAYWFNTRK